MSIARQLLAECRKSAHPITAALVALVAGATIAFSFSTERFAMHQTPVAAVNSVLLEENVVARCLTHFANHSQVCVNSRINHASNQRFRRGGNDLGTAVRAIQTSFAGSVAFASGQFATGLGWLLILGLAALLVAGEWQGHVITSTLLANPRIGRFLLAKIFAVWVTGITAMLGAGFVLGAAHALFANRFPIIRSPDVRGLTRAQLQHLASVGMERGGVGPIRADAHWSSAAFAFERVGGAAVILLGFATLAVGLAVLIRRQLILLLVGIGVLVFVSQSHLLGRLSPLNVIGATMRFARTPFGVQDHFLWKAPGAMRDIYDSPHASALSFSALVCWSLLVAATTFAAHRRLTTGNRI